MEETPTIAGTDYFEIKMTTSNLPEHTYFDSACKTIDRIVPFYTGIHKNSIATVRRKKGEKSVYTLEDVVEGI